jgi:CheY-like chemotaxis protein/anti-sigma regulatory factor (Ser/Thr protein kinase)
LRRAVALLNLLINARDAVPVGGQITVSARVRDAQDQDAMIGRRVEVSVVDTGTGMEEHVLHQAIEPFFTTKRVGAGSGLGLSMVHGFAEQSGGILRISTAVGQGTTITMAFPADEKGSDDLPEHVQRDSDLPSLKILLVEDESSIRRLLVRLLEKAGAAVHAVETGDAAAAIEGRWSTYDLLITDIVMPGLLQGDVLAQHFSDRCPGTPIMLMSGNPEIMNSVRPRGSARTAILAKPVRQAELVRAIVDLVR